MKGKCILDEFTFFEMQRTEREIHYLSHKYYAPNYAWVFSCNSLEPSSDCTDSHDMIISHEIMNNRKFLLYPSSGHILTRCAFVDNFEFVTNTAFEVFIWMFLLGSFLEMSWVAFLVCVVSLEMAAEAAAVLPWLTHQLKQPTSAGWGPNLGRSIMGNNGTHYCPL